MRTPHLLRVDGPPESYAALFAAARSEDLRLGWLELSGGADAAPASLAAAAGLGALRAVAATPGRTVALKPLAGASVLADLLHEHFRGCAAVLIAAGAPAGLPSLVVDPAGDRWRVLAPDRAAIVLGAEELARRLRRPRPWG